MERSSQTCRKQYFRQECPAKVSSKSVQGVSKSVKQGLVILYVFACVCAFGFAGYILVFSLVFFCGKGEGDLQSRCKAQTCTFFDPVPSWWAVRLDTYEVFEMKERERERESKVEDKNR